MRKKERKVSIRGRRDSKLYGQHVSAHPGRRYDFVAYGSNIHDVLIVHQVCRAMHLDDGFVSTKSMVAVLEVKGKCILCTILDEYIAEWASDKMVNMLGLVASISNFSPGVLAVELALDAYLSPGIGCLKGGQLVVVLVVDKRHAD